MWFVMPVLARRYAARRAGHRLLMEMPWRDRTLSMARIGYPWGLKLTSGAQAAQTVLMLRRTVVGLGPEMARAFYAPGAFERRGVLPLRARATLTGLRAIQSIDGDRHRERKAHFLSLLGEQGVRDFMAIFQRQWRESRADWTQSQSVSLHERIPDVLAMSACSWAGIPADVLDDRDPTGLLQDLYESPARIGPGHWQGRAARVRLERRLSRLIRDIRGDEVRVESDSPVHSWAMYRENGHWLPARVAAVEVLNLLRPIVAIERYLLFVTHALASHAAWRERLRQADTDDVLNFANEVRRLYPFFPGVMGRATRETTIAGIPVAQGEVMMLDLYGSSHHADTWESPGTFDPDRFRRQPIDDFNLIPQGGGDATMTHRCPGEALTVAVMGFVALDLASDTSWHAADHRDRTIKLNEIPAMPQAGMVVASR
jgi:fatty-acid peroxygenase